MHEFVLRVKRRLNTSRQHFQAIDSFFIVRYVHLRLICSLRSANRTGGGGETQREKISGPIDGEIMRRCGERSAGRRVHDAMVAAAAGTEATTLSTTARRRNPGRSTQPRRPSYRVLYSSADV